MSSNMLAACALIFTGAIFVFFRSDYHTAWYCVSFALLIREYR